MIARYLFELQDGLLFKNTCGLPSYASDVSKHADNTDAVLRSDL